MSLTPPKEIVQKWALQSPTWPEGGAFRVVWIILSFDAFFIPAIGHSGTLTVTLEQSSDSTQVTFSLDGVPKGLEDEITRNLEGY